MTILKLLFVYSLILAGVDAHTYTKSTNGTTNWTAKMRTIPQCIWDHGIFCIMIDFLDYRQPSFRDDLSQDKYSENEPFGVMESIPEDSTSFLGDRMTPYPAGVITPSVTPKDSFYGRCERASSPDSC